MLIEFRVENFRSIREPITLSLIATSLDSKDPVLGKDNVIPVSKNLTLLRSAVIYGANASGKSNIIRAFAFFSRLINDSARESQADDPIPTEPFLLRDDTRSQPSSFEIVFLLDGIQYRYGFKVTRQRVVAEWLFFTPTTREATLFTRDESGIHIPSHSLFREGRGLEERARPNALFLSVAAQFNGEIATKIRYWLVRQCRFVNVSIDMSHIPHTSDFIEMGKFGWLFEKFIAELDLDITGLLVQETPVPEHIARALSAMDGELNGSAKTHSISENHVVKEIVTRHTIRDENGHAVREETFPLDEMESEGTQKLIALCGPLFDVLTNGRVLFIDEIDARLHPLLTTAIVRLFHSEETNPKNAQLVCATHDTNLLDGRLFRRDQVFFTEKQEGATRLYSLAEFKPKRDDGESGGRVRSDASFERNYIEGRYGAIPYLGDLRRLFTEAQALEGEREPAAV